MFNRFPVTRAMKLPPVVSAFQSHLVIQGSCHCTVNQIIELILKIFMTLGQSGYDATPGKPVHLSEPNQRYNHTLPRGPGIPPAPTSSSCKGTAGGSGHQSIPYQYYNHNLPGSPGNPHAQIFP